MFIVNTGNSAHSGTITVYLDIAHYVTQHTVEITELVGSGAAELH